MNYVFDAQEAAKAVYRIFDRSCAECHDGVSKARSKGRFGTVMDFDAMREDSGFVHPGDGEHSPLYHVVIDPDPEFVMPPVDSDCPPLNEFETELVKMWIDGGAVTPVWETESDAAVKLETEAAAEPAPPPSSTILKLFGKLHPMVVHFPIALVWSTFLAALWGAFIQKKGTAWVILWCLSLAAAFSLLAGATGWINASVSGYTDESVWNHRWSGVAASVLIVLSLILQLASLRGDRSGRKVLFWLCLAASVIAVSFSGHTGGELIYGDETFFNLLISNK